MRSTNDRLLAAIKTPVTTMTTEDWADIARRAKRRVTKKSRRRMPNQRRRRA